MPYSIQLIEKDQQVTSKWSGGDTTELAIYPADADYTKRNFSWRISSAVVEVEESVFTKLPAVERILMVLDGEMTLTHEGHHQMHLTPYEQDRFSGGWTTHSYGKVRDFNLMLADGYSGALEAISVREDDFYEIASEECGKVEAFYCVEGQVSVKVHEAIFDLAASDFLLINRDTVDEAMAIQLINQVATEAKVIRATLDTETTRQS